MKNKTELMNPHTPRKDKIKRRDQNFKKFGKTVAAATIGDYLVNLDLWTIYSLNNRLFKNQHVEFF